MWKFALQILPKRTLTTVVSWFSGTSFSRHLVPWYARHYQIDASLADRPLSAFTSLKEFFSRQLRPGARPIAPVGLVSPVDGTVSEVGPIVNGQLLQAKGIYYALSALLGDKDAADSFEGGHYLTLYLSPHDYHRIHMPLEAVVMAWRYIPGALYPVNRHGVSAISGLFTRNERLVTLCTSELGQFAVVKVGATVVGSIRSAYGPDYARPRRRFRRGIQEGETRLPLQRGEELGWFEFGSTVIVILAPGMLSSFLVKTGQTVQMGQQVAHLHT